MTEGESKKHCRTAFMQHVLPTLHSGLGENLGREVFEWLETWEGEGVEWRFAKSIASGVLTGHRPVQGIRPEEAA